MVRPACAPNTPGRARPVHAGPPLAQPSDRLRTGKWRGVYYLYLDEAGRYANRNLADLLAYKTEKGLSN